MKNRYLIFLPFILWIGIIFTISSVPSTDIPQELAPHIDKGVHLFEYLVLFVFYLYATQGKYKVWGLLIIVFLSIIDEYHQRFIPGREASIFDILTDITGGGLGFWLLKR